MAAGCQVWMTAHELIIGHRVIALVEHLSAHWHEAGPTVQLEAILQSMNSKERMQAANHLREAEGMAAPADK